MFKNEDDFESIVGRLNIDNKPNPAHRENLRRKVLSAFNETSEQPESQVTVFQNIRRTIMKSPITKLATAAVVVVAVMIGVHQFKLSVSPELVPIDIKLPKAMFVGTKQNIQGVTKLEEPRPAGVARSPFLAPVGTKNVASGKSVSSSDKEPIIGEIEMVTDGDKEAADGSYVELGPFMQHVTIDLEAEYDIYAVLVWHYHKEGRVYIDVVVQVADDPDFITNVRTLFNNDNDNSSGLGIGKDMHYVETHEGKLIDARGVRARYVRLYSRGSSSNDLNHYIEVEIFGKPAK